MYTGDLKGGFPKQEIETYLQKLPLFCYLIFQVLIADLNLQNLFRPGHDILNIVGQWPGECL